MDDLVWQHLINLLEDPNLIQQEIKKRSEQAANSDPIRIRKERLIKQKIKLTKSIDKLLDAYQEHLITLEELRKRIPILRKREATLDAELNSLQAKSLYQDQNQNTIRNIENFLAQLRLNAKEMDIKNKKKILQLLVKEILIEGNSIIINHSIKVKERIGTENDQCYLLRTGSISALVTLVTASK